MVTLLPSKFSWYVHSIKCHFQLKVTHVGVSVFILLSFPYKIIALSFYISKNVPIPRPQIAVYPFTLLNPPVVPNMSGSSATRWRPDVIYKSPGGLTSGNRNGLLTILCEPLVNKELAWWNTTPSHQKKDNVNTWQNTINQFTEPKIYLLFKTSNLEYHTGNNFSIYGSKPHKDCHWQIQNTLQSIITLSVHVIQGLSMQWNSLFQRNL